MVDDGMPPKRSKNAAEECGPVMTSFDALLWTTSKEEELVVR
jgi:hypothetical protein